MLARALRTCLRALVDAIVYTVSAINSSLY